MYIQVYSIKSKSSFNESGMLVNPRCVIEDPNQRIYNDSIG